MRVQVLGICRFSLLVEGGFQVTHETLEDRRRMLYDPDRLARRFLWFEQVCLPGLAAQTDPDFTLVLLTGEDFPKPWLDRLRDLIAGTPQIVLVQAPPGHHREVCRAAIQARIEPKASAVAQFRQDDDDAVAVDFVERVRAEFIETLVPIYARHAPLALDYCRGFLLSTRGDQVEVMPQMAHNLVAALVLFMRARHGRTVLEYPHQKITNVMAGVSLPDVPMFVRGKHETNDGRGPLREGTDWPVEQGAIPELLAERFRIDLAAFRAGVAALGGTRGWTR